MNKIKDKIDLIQYISLKDAAKLCSYSQDYLSLRARQGKLKAIKSGRNWVTTKEWLNKYIGRVNSYVEQVNNKKSVSKKIKKENFIENALIKTEKTVLKAKDDILCQAEKIKDITEKYISALIDRVLSVYDKFIIKKNKINEAIGDVCSQLASYNKEIKNSIKPKFIISAALISFLLISSFFAFNPQARASITNLGEEIAEFIFTTGQNIVLLTQNTKRSAGNLFDSIIIRSPQLIEESTYSIKTISSKANSNIQDKFISLSERTFNTIKSVPNLIKGFYTNIDKLVISINKAPEKIFNFAISANKENENLKLTLKRNSVIIFNEMKFEAKNISKRVIQIPLQIRELRDKAIYAFTDINKENEKVKLLFLNKAKNGYKFVSDIPEIVSSEANETTNNLSDIYASALNILSDMPEKLSHISINTGKKLISSYQSTGSYLDDSINNLNRKIKQAPKNISAGFFNIISDLSNNVKSKLGDAYIKIAEFVIPGYSFYDQENYLIHQDKEEITITESSVSSADGPVVQQVFPKAVTETITITETLKVIETTASADLTQINQDIEDLSNRITSLGNQISSKIDYTVPSHSPVYIPSSGIQVSGHALLTSLNVTGSGAIGGSLGVAGNASFGNTKDSTTVFDVYSDATFHNSVNFDSGLSAMTLSSTGNTTIAGTLTAATTTLSQLTINNDLLVSGNATTSGSYYIGKDLTVAGAFNQSGASASFATTTIVGDFTVQDFGGSNTHLYVQNNTGNLGIGTTTPTVSLVIDSTNGLLIPVGTDAQRPDGMTGIIRYNTDSTRFEGYANSSWTGLGGLIDIDQDTYVLAESSPGTDEDMLFFYTSSTETMRLTNVGNLGIGTTTPDSKLTVIGRMHASSTSEQLRLTYDLESSKYASFTIDSSGDLTIDLATTNSTTTISNNLSVLGYLNVEGNATTSGSYYIAKDLTVAGTFNQSGGAAAFATTTVTGDFTVQDFGGSNTHLYVQNNTGNVGIGTTSPVTRFAVGGDAGDTTGHGYFTGGLGVGVVNTTANSFQVGQCVTGDTLLKRRRRRRRKDGTYEYVYEDVRIDQVKPGDEILTLDDKTGKLKISKVKKLMYMGKKPIVEITTSLGRKIRTTANHPYFARVNQPKIKKPKLGIFYDDANMFYAQRKAGWRIDIKKFKKSLSKQFDISAFDYYVATPEKQDKAFNKTVNFISKIKRQVQIVTKLIKYIKIDDGLKKKADMDVEIALGVVKHIKDLDVVMIISGDSDLLPLKNYVLEKGKKIIYAGFRENMAWELAVNSKYLYLNGFRDELKLGKKTTPKPKFGVALLSLLYSSAPSLSSGGMWRKVSQLKTGQEIAILDDNNKSVWDTIKNIRKLPAEDVYDIEVEGTHNFIGNNIVAHNTAFIVNSTGNIGIGTTTPDSKLTVIGRMHASSTSEQLRLTYDLESSKYASFTIDSNGDLTIDLATTNATTTFSDNVQINGNLGGGSPLNIVTDVITSGYASSTNGLYTQGNIHAGGTLTVDGTTTLTGDITQTGNLNITGYASTTAGLFTLGEIRTASNLTADGNLLINANATTTGSINVDGDFLTDGTGSFANTALTIDSSGNLTTTGYASTTTYLNTQGSIHAGGNASIDGTLDVLGVTTLGSNLDLGNNLILNIGHTDTDFTTGGGLNLAGNVGIGTTTPDSKLTVIGRMHASSTSEQLRLTYDVESSKYASFTINSDGDLTIDLATTNATTTFSNNIQINGNLGGGSPLNIVTDVITSGSATTTNRLVLGTTNPTTNDLLWIGGNTFLTGYASSTNGLYTQGSIHAGGDLTIDGTTTLTGDITQTGNLNITGYASTTAGLFTQSNIHAGGTFSVDGASTFNNTITQTGTGQVTFTGNLNATNGLNVTTANLTVGGSNFIIDQSNGNLTTLGYASSTAGLFTQGSIEAGGNLLIRGNATTTGSINIDGDFLTYGTGSFASANLTIDSSGNLTTTGYASTTAGLFTLGNIHAGGTFSVDGNTSLQKATSTFFYASGDITAGGNISGVTYGSNASVSDAELLYINTLSSNAQTQLDARLTLTNWFSTTTHALLGNLNAPDVRITGILHASTTDFDLLTVTGNTSLQAGTSTNWAISGLGGGGGDLKIAADGSVYEGSDASGSGGSAAWKYSGASWNTIQTTSTLGILLTASSTFQNTLTVQRASGGSETLFQVGTSTDEDIFVVKSNGRVGIGTAAPTSDLHVSDGSSSGITANYGASLLITDDAIPRIYFEDSTQGADDKVMDIHYKDENLVIGSLTDTATTFEIENILVVNRDGNVGIGTTTPGTWLGGTLTVQGTSNILRASGGTEQLFTVGTTTDTDIFVVKSNGNVGIGTAVPGDNLHIVASANKGLTIEGGTPTILLDDTGGSNVDNFSIVNGGAFVAFTDATDDIIIMTLGLTTNQGNVGIGTTSPSFLFSVHGNALANSWGVYDMFEMVFSSASSTEVFEEGDLLTLAKGNTNTFTKTTTAYDSNIIGAAKYISDIDTFKPAVFGSFDIKVSNVNGDINIGDAVTSSDEPGLGMKASRSGMIIGYAMEPFFGTATSTATSTPIETSKIKVMINSQWHNPSPQFVALQNGFVGIATTTPTNILTIGQGAGNAIADGWNVYSSADYKTEITYLEEEDYDDILEQIDGMSLATYQWDDGVTSSSTASTTPGYRMLGLFTEEAPAQILGQDNKSISLYDYTSFAIAGVKALKTEVDEFKDLFGVIENEDGSLSMPPVSSGDNEPVIIYESGQPMTLAVDEDGFVVLEKLKVGELEIAAGGQLTLPEGPDEIIGQGLIATSSDFVLIENNKIATSSKIFVSFTSNLAGASWWVCDKVDGESFKVCLSEEAIESLNFDYWIVQARDASVVEENVILNDSEGSIDFSPPEAGQNDNEEDPVIEEPVVEEPVVEEPVVEEPVVEEESVPEESVILNDPSVILNDSEGSIDSSPPEAGQNDNEEEPIIEEPIIEETALPEEV